MKNTLFAALFTVLILGLSALSQQSTAPCLPVNKPACGAELATFPITNGAPACYNGPSQGTGNSCAGGASFQCVEYVKRFYKTVLGVDTAHWIGNANQYFATAAAKGLVSFANPNRVPPAPNDILVFDGDTYGHVAIVESVTSTGIQIIEQNWSPTGRASLVLTNTNGNYEVSSRGRYTVIGWLRKQSSNIVGGTFFDKSAGLIGTAFLFDPRVGGGATPAVDIQGPPNWNNGNPITCGLYQPPGAASTRSICWEFIPPVTGEYTATPIGSFAIDASITLITPSITSFSVAPGQLTLTWTQPVTPGSILVRVSPIPFNNIITQEMVVSGDTRTFTFQNLGLVRGAQYQASVFAFSRDVRTPDLLSDPFDIGDDSIVFTAP